MKDNIEKNIGNNELKNHCKNIINKLADNGICYNRNIVRDGTIPEKENKYKYMRSVYKIIDFTYKGERWVNFNKQFKLAYAKFLVSYSKENINKFLRELYIDAGFVTGEGTFTREFYIKIK